MDTPIRMKTVKLLHRLLQPLTEEGLLRVAEQQAIIANLKHLATKGELIPAIAPKLIDQRQAAEILGIGLSNFKKLERGNAFPTIPRKMVGSAVRYCNIDVIQFVLAGSED